MRHVEGRGRPRRRELIRKTLCGVSAAALSASLVAVAPGLVSSASAATPTYSTNTTSYCKSGATPVTFWAWVPGIYRVVDVFNQTHPNICVDYVTKVGGSGEYIPLLNALKAHSGAPDVAEIEFDVLPSFEVLHYVTNLSPYGAGQVQERLRQLGVVRGQPGQQRLGHARRRWVDGLALQLSATGQVRHHHPTHDLGTVRCRRPESAHRPTRRFSLGTSPPVTANGCCPSCSKPGRGRSCGTVAAK